MNLSVLHTESSLGWGGQENRTLNECVGLAARGHRVLVAAPPTARLLERAAAAGLATFAIPMPGSASLPAIWRLSRLMAREKPDIVSTHSGRDTLLAGLAARGHRVLVAAPPTARLLERAAAAGLATFAIPMPGSASLPAIWRLSRLMAREKPDIVSTHSGRDTLLAGMAARLLRHRPRIVRTRHLILPITSRMSYDGLPDHVVTVSQAVREQLLAAGVPADHLTAVPTGIDFSRFDRTQVVPALRQELGLADGTVLIGTIAILRKGKGHHHLLEAAAMMLARGAPVHFAFAGDGPQMDNLRRQATGLGIEQNVSFLGLRRDVPAVLAALDIFVLPTRQEALGTSFIEAQGMGVPVVGSRVGGVPETMIENETGLLVPAEDPPALAAALETLVGDPRRRRLMGQRGASFVRSRYSIDEMVEGMLAVYQRQLEAS